MPCCGHCYMIVSQPEWLMNRLFDLYWRHVTCLFFGRSLRGRCRWVHIQNPIPTNVVCLSFHCLCHKACPIVWSMRQLRFLFQFPVLDVVFDQEPVKMGVYVVTDDTLLSRLTLLMCMHVYVVLCLTCTCFIRSYSIYTGWGLVSLCVAHSPAQAQLPQRPKAT